MEFEVKSPILGFEYIQKMKLEKIDEDVSKFIRLVSCGDDGISFTLVNPYAVRSDYVFEFPAAIRALLEIKGKLSSDTQETQFAILNIVCVRTPIDASTINFLAPLVFNFDNQTMAQVVLDSTKYENYGLSESLSSFDNPNNEQP